MTIAALSITACAQKTTDNEVPASKTLVAYFSATGTTADAAKIVAEATDGELYEIIPEKRYTTADLDWRDEQSRSYVEMHDLAFRPAIKNKKENISEYGTIYIGFPIWWNIAPTIINTFIESHDLKGKKVIPFATSGGSTIENSVKELKDSYPEINWQDGKLLNRTDESSIRRWLDRQ